MEEARGDGVQSRRRADLTSYSASGKATVALEAIPRTVCMVSHYIIVIVYVAIATYTCIYLAI